jgi:hypothetical protein
LWIDVDAVLSDDRRLTEVLAQGLARPEHPALVQSLAQAKAARGRCRELSPRKRKGRGGHS